MEDRKCATCLFFNGGIKDEKPQFCDEKEVFVSKNHYCARYIVRVEADEMDDNGQDSH